MLDPYYLILQVQNIVLKHPNPTESMWLKAIYYQPEMIFKSKNPTEQMWEDAIYGNANLILKILFPEGGE